MPRLTVESSDLTRSLGKMELSRLRAGNTPENGKGCDIGYVPAVCSCEEADSVDACTVAALDAITAFAVPNPGPSSQESAGFFGSGCSSGYPDDQITQPTSEWQGLFRQSFQPSTWDKLNSCGSRVNVILGVKTKYLCMEVWKTRHKKDSSHLNTDDEIWDTIRIEGR